MAFCLAMVFLNQTICVRVIVITLRYLMYFFQVSAETLLMPSGT